MALIVPSGGLVSQVNGKVDDKVYYRGRWGNVVRAWVNPTNTITPERTAVRNLFASLMSLFNSLTPDMQDDWNNFAAYLIKHNRLAQPYIPTGLQIFIERNMNLSRCSLPLLLLPPEDTGTLFSDIVTFSSPVITPTSLIVNLDIYPANSFAHGFIIFYASNNQSASRTSMFNRYRIIQPTDIVAPFTTDWILPWLNTWTGSIPTVGKKIFLKAVGINKETGEASAPAYCSQIVTP
jgi:hypothetical protein